jgi:RPA family protein
MRVHELIDILNDQPPDAEVELAIIAPVDGETDDITVDRYFVDGVLPWHDSDDDDGAEIDDGEFSIWLVGGEEPDVNAFLDAIEQPDA